MTETDRPSERVWIAGHNRRAKAAAIAEFGKPAAERAREIDLAVLAPQNPAEAIYFAEKIADRLATDARMIVVIEASPAESDHAGRIDQMAKTLTPLAWQAAGQTRLGQTHLALEFRRA